MLAYLMPMLDIWAGVWSAQMSSEPSLDSHICAIEIEKVAEKEAAEARFHDVRAALLATARR